jgi:RNA 2',3'-cyclic 3'-phosphodiesterase
MRLFVGFLLPEEYKDFVLKLQSEITTLDVDCKNVEQENLHLSMSFLGETAEEDAEKIKKDLAKIAAKFKKIDVTICGAKAIPNKNFFRVIALDVTEGSGSLDKLLEEIRQRIGGDVKPPHLTLCRVKSTRNKERLVEFVEKYETACFSSIKISSLQLIESKLGRNGPEYSIISESVLHD